MSLVLPNRINVCQAKANVAEGLLILLPPCTPRLSRVMLSDLLLTCCSHGGCCTGREPKYNCYPAAHWWQTGRWPVSVPRCCCRAATCCAGNLCFQQGPRKPLGDYERGWGPQALCRWRGRCCLLSGTWMELGGSLASAPGIPAWTGCKVSYCRLGVVHDASRKACCQMRSKTSLVRLCGSRALRKCPHFSTMTPTALALFSSGLYSLREHQSD